MTPRQSVYRATAGYRWSIILDAVFASLGAVAELAIALLVSQVVSLIASGEGERGTVDAIVFGAIQPTTAVLLILLAIAFRFAFDIADVVLRASISARYDRDSRTKLAAAFLNASWPAQQQTSAGELQELSTTFVSQGRTVIKAATDLLSSGVSAVVLVAGALSLGGPTLIGLGGVVALAFLALRPLVRRTGQWATEMSGASPKYAHELSVVIRGIRPLRLYQAQRPAMDLLETRATEIMEALRRYLIATALVPIIYQDVSLGLLALALLYVLGLPSTDASNGLAIAMLGFRILQQSRTVQSSVQAIVSGAPFLVRLEEHLASYTLDAELEPQSDDTGAVPGHAQRAHEGTRSPCDIEFASVSFGYPGRPEPVLVDASFRIEPGTIAAVVGPSGAGKSTALQLLLGLRRPSEGSILIDSRPTHEYSREEWHGLLATVDQAPIIFDLPVSENVRFFRPWISDDAVKGALGRAHILQEMLELPKGLETILDPDGTSISGGQAQRLCIARALAGSPRLLVLDEPTSSLDGLSEQRIADTLLELRGTTTIVVVSHRPALVEIADIQLSVGSGTIQPVGNADSPKDGSRA